MLNLLDDYPIHQTPEPIAVPATSDRNAYDRTWFNGYSADGSWYFAFGMAIYPHRGVLDAAFSAVSVGGQQHCFYASRRAPLERTEMHIGPLSVEIEEPMRRARLVLDDNDSGLGCDLVFSARTGALEEARQTLWSGSRRLMDATRFAQFGRWSGVLATPEGERRVEAANCFGTKDRSWGIRGVGEPETGGAPRPGGSAFFLWTPLVWDDHVSHAIFFDDPRGGALVREGLTAPLFDSEKEVPPPSEETVTRMETARHRVRYESGTRYAERAEVDLVEVGGATRTLHLEPGLRFLMKGLGYHHPQWRQGAWQGEESYGHESFDPTTLDPLAPENIHVQQLVRANDGQRDGRGVLEHLVFGPYAPAGFQHAFDGAR